MSRIGKKVIAVPAGVSVNFADGVVAVKGPKGSLSRKITGNIDVKSEGGEVLVVALDEKENTNALHGLYRALIADMVKGVAEGFVRVLIFVGYLAAISRMKDIQRTFMYHGAEHKCINCIENGMELKVENVRLCSREHKRCGTSFLFIVMFISIVFIMMFSIPLFMLFHVNTAFWRIVLRLALLPLIAGVSYEFIRLAGCSDNPLVNLLSKPGMAMQHMTTKEPDDSMIEVAIAEVEAVFDWKKFLNEQYGTHYETEDESDRESDEMRDSTQSA